MDPSTISVVVLVVGVAILVAIGSAAIFQRARLPVLIGWLVIGFVIRLVDDATGLFPDEGSTVIEFLGRLGIIALLFRIGLEADVRGLLDQLRGASGVWVANVVLSGLLGYLAAVALGFGPVPSLVAATALTATSVGISSAVWREEGALRTPEGELFLDVAELDDISAVVLMGVLLAVLPEVADGSVEAGAVLSVLGLAVLKFAALAVVVVLFALYAEERLTLWLDDVGAPPAPAIIGVGFIIAAVAGLLGFSEAIGAFMAGLAFSRDPQWVRIDASIGPLHDLLAPFFFIAVGVSIPPGAVGAAVVPGLVLSVAAIVGKVIGAGGPAVRPLGWSGATLLGVSMVPRAEIALVVTQRARQLDGSAVPDDLFSAMVLVALVTSIGAPIVMRRYLFPARSR